MIIREVERGGGAIVRAMRARQAEADRERASRYPGLHFSTIVNDYVDTLYPMNYPEIPEAQRFALYEMGDVIEDLIADELRRRNEDWVKPTPKKVSGVWLSPDGWAQSSRTIDEMKSTRISCGKVIRRPTGQIDGIEEHHKLLKHVLQLKGYMHGWGAKRGRLHELFLNGDWRPPFPMPRSFVLRPETDHECRDTFDQMLDHASDRGML